MARNLAEAEIPEQRALQKLELHSYFFKSIHMQYDVSSMQNTSEEHELLLWCEIKVGWKNENAL